MKKWMEVPFAYFLIAHVPPMIKNKTGRTKNKGCKPHGASMYLTLICLINSNDKI
jgi:hypothetical protein